MSRRRRVLRWLVGFVVALGLLTLTGRWLLTSRLAARLVAEQLQAQLGAPVDLGGVDVGLFGATTLYDIQVFEPDRSAVWLRAERLTTDVSLWDAVFGTVHPSQVAVSGVRVEIHFSAQGAVLTQFPKPPEGAGDNSLPVVLFTDATLLLRQDGRPLFVVHNIAGRLDTQDTTLAVAGSAADPDWGKWTFQGRLTQPTGTASLALHAESAALTPDRLASIPFVPAEVTTEVRPCGSVAADILLRFESGPSQIHYRAALGLQGIDLELRTVGLHTTDTRGEVVVEDGVLALRDVTGRLGTGDLKVSGGLDLLAQPERGQLTLEVRKVELSAFPPAWDMPPQLTGLFTGKATLGVVLSPRFTLTGSGAGQVDQATVAGIAVADPIQLRLHADARGLALSHDFSISSLPGVCVAFVSAALRPPWLPFPTYLHARLRMEGADLEILARAFKIELPAAVQGSLYSELDLAIPINTPTDPKRYYASGRFEIRNGCIEKQPIERLSASFRLQSGVLAVSSLQIDTGAITNALTGQVRLPLFASGDITAQLQFKRLALPTLVRERFPDIPLEEGVLSGAVQVRIPGDRVKEIATWTISGNVVVDQMRTESFTLDWLSARFALENGTIVVTDFQAGWQGLRVEGAGGVNLEGTRVWDATLRLHAAEMELVRQLLPVNEAPLPLTGLFSATASLNGTLQPLRLQGSGSGKLANLHGPAVEAKAVDFKWEATQETFHLLELHCDRLEVQRIPVEQVEGKLDYDRGQLAFRLDAEVFNGHVQFDGQTSQTVGMGPNIPDSLEGSVRLEGVPIDRFWTALRLPEMKALRADVDLESTYRVSMRESALTDWWRTIQANGRIWLNRVRWDRSDVGSEMRADFRWQNEQIELRDVTGGIAQGRLRARGVVYPEQLARSWFEVNLDRVESSRLLQMLQGTTAGNQSLAPDIPLIQGPLEVRLRGSLGRVWRGSGQLVLGRGKVFGVEVNEWRVPLRLSYTPERQSGQIDIRDSSAQVARGRLDIDATLGWGLGSQIKGTLRFFHVNLPTLLKPFVRLQQIGQGRISGHIDFAGRNVHSINDLTASMEAQLRQTQALEFPVLREIGSFFPAVRTSSLFANGNLRASLTRGVVRIQPLTFEGTLLDLLIEGTVTVPQGRLALDVTAHTASMAPDPMLIRLIGMPLIGPVPTVVLVRASNYLASRILHLRVSGTLRTPIVRIEPVQLLTEEAVRFFLARPSMPRQAPGTR